MVDFELQPKLVDRIKSCHAVAEQMMRPISRQCDEREHEPPWEFFETVWSTTTLSEDLLVGKSGKGGKGAGAPEPRNLGACLGVEELSWGDAGLFLALPSAMAGAAVIAAGTPEQVEKFLERFRRRQGQPKWGALAITEPGCGSDTAAITTTATRDGDCWVLNGTKMFCTNGQMAAEKSEGFIVVWATVDKSAGRAGIKPFVVEHDTPGMSVLRVENKLGQRASNTTALVLDNCRIPLDHLLGSLEAPREAGFKSLMATLDATRPIVVAQALGVGRAALDFVRDFLSQRQVAIRYGLSPSKLTALERDFMEMEVQLKAARLLLWRAAWLLDMGMDNNLEASMAKAKAGMVVTWVTQKAVEILGPLGYSRKLLVEKWMRDAKILDIYEGTRQINMLVIARRILGYSAKELN